MSSVKDSALLKLFEKTWFDIVTKLLKHIGTNDIRSQVVAFLLGMAQWC